MFIDFLNSFDSLVHQVYRQPCCASFSIFTKCIQKVRMVVALTNETPCGSNSVPQTIIYGGNIITLYVDSNYISIFSCDSNVWNSSESLAIGNQAKSDYQLHDPLQL